MELHNTKSTHMLKFLGLKLTVNLSTLCFYVYVLFLCTTSLLLDIRLVLAYLLSLMSGHSKVIM